MKIKTFVKSAKLHQFTLTVTPGPGDNPISKVIITVPALTTPDTTVENGMSEKKQHIVTFTRIESNSDVPKVVSIQRLGSISQEAVSAFQEKGITGPVDVRIVLTEQPHGGLTLDLINVERGAVSNLVVGVPFARHGVDGDADNTLIPHPFEGMYEHAGDGPLAGVLQGVAGSGNVPLSYKVFLGVVMSRCRRVLIICITSIV